MSDKSQKKINEFIEQLLFLFEDRNKILYKMLLVHRHRVKNVVTFPVFEQLLKDYLAQDIVLMILNRDPRFFHQKFENEQLTITINMMWESCTSENKAIIWKWLQSIVKTLLPQDAQQDRSDYGGQEFL